MTIILFPGKLIFETPLETETITEFAITNRVPLTRYPAIFYRELFVYAYYIITIVVIKKKNNKKYNK